MEALAFITWSKIIGSIILIIVSGLFLGISTTIRSWREEKETGKLDYTPWVNFRNSLLTALVCGVIIWAIVIGLALLS